GSSPERAVPAYRRLRMPRKRPQVLGADLNRPEIGCMFSQLPRSAHGSGTSRGTPYLRGRPSKANRQGRAPPRVGVLGGRGEGEGGGGAACREPLAAGRDDGGIRTRAGTTTPPPSRHTAARVITQQSNDGIRAIRELRLSLSGANRKCSARYERYRS